jgi:NifU-like protein
VVYPKKICERLTNLQGLRDERSQPDADGVAANFECGSYVRFFVYSGQGGVVGDLRYHTNGCGYMTAAADVLSEYVSGSDLKALHGLERAELRSHFESTIGAFPHTRDHCLETVIDAVRNAFADLRQQQVEEYQGETALICTCFGVTQDRIDDIIRTCRIRSVDEVTAATNAGRGCGSCRMLIQEIIDQQLTN